MLPLPAQQSGPLKLSDQTSTLSGGVASAAAKSTVHVVGADVAKASFFEWKVAEQLAGFRILGWKGTGFEAMWPQEVHHTGSEACHAMPRVLGRWQRAACETSILHIPLNPKPESLDGRPHAIIGVSTYAVDLSG